MSKLRLNGSTSGYAEITAPDVAANNTITLPSQSGSIIVQGNSAVPVVIGSGTSTGTASQTLQVTGGAYVSGNLGIGTTNPQSILHLQSSGSIIRFTESDATTNNRNWNVGVNGQTFFWQALTDAGSGGGNQFKITRSAEQIQTFEGQNSGVTWFTINNDTTRVGIGTTNPSSSLHVAGSRDSTPTQPGVHIGEGGTNDFALEICCRNSSANSYIDFTHPGQDYKGRVLKTMGGSFSIQNTEATSMTLYNNGDNRLIIDSSGRVRMPFQPAFMAGSTSGTHTTNVGSVLDFNTEGNSGFDVGGNFNTTNYRFTAPIAGIYAFSSNVYVQNSGTASSFCWRKNGTQLFAPGGDVLIVFSAGVNDFTIGSSILLNLAANDFIDIAVRTGTNNVQWYGPHSWIMGYLVG